jgi:hypothetical protein
MRINSQDMLGPQVCGLGSHVPRRNPISQLIDRGFHGPQLGVNRVESLRDCLSQQQEVVSAHGEPLYELISHLIQIKHG